MAADPRPSRRVVDRNVQPLDERPLMFGCPLCGRMNTTFSRAHVVPKGVGGDDVPENVAWICGDGVMGCHGCLTHRNRVIGHPITPEIVAQRFVAYCREIVPQLGEYADRKKHAGWLEAYYLGDEAVAA